MTVLTTWNDEGQYYKARALGRLMPLIFCLASRNISLTSPGYLPQDEAVPVLP